LLPFLEDSITDIRTERGFSLQVHLTPEEFRQFSFQGDHVKKANSLREGDEQINVAVRSCLSPRRGTVEEEGSHGIPSAQGDYIGSICKG
jgi:hypothetical protein